MSFHQLAHYASALKALNSRWKPHEGQKVVGTALFTEMLKSIFVQCGRKWGKTEIGLYILWRWAMTFPGLGCFYVTPELKQGKKIVWEDPRMLNFGPPEWISDVNQSETRIRLHNKSYLKLDGSDNFEAHRGTRPGILVYEEYKDHDPRFREVMRPNLSVYQAPEIFLGTPPEVYNEYDRTAEEHKNTPGKLFYHAPTWQNPGISKEWLWDEKKRLYLRGEGDVWEREYAAKNVKGGAKKIFSMLDKDMVRPHAELMKELWKDRKKLLWTWWADPGTSSCFAVLFTALNPYTKKLYLLDEIYEKRESEMTTRRIGRVALNKRDELWEKEWRQGYDEEAAWFRNEFWDNFNEYLEPSHKHLHDKEVGLTLIKDMMLGNYLVFSDRCVQLYWEMDNYYKDKNGNIPKKNDHLIDDLRYILGALNYQMTEAQEHDETKDENWRGERLEDALMPNTWNEGDYREV